MDPVVLDIVAPMIMMIVLTLTIGGVILLKPLSKHLGRLLEAMADERQNPAIGRDMVQIQQQLDAVTSRLSLLEERQDFHERLLESPDRRARRREMDPTDS